MEPKQGTPYLTRLREQLINLAGEIQKLPPGDSAKLSEALRQANLNALFDASRDDMARFPEENPNPVIRLSLDGSLLYRNKAAEAVLSADCRTHRSVPSFFHQLAREFSQDCPRQTLEYQLGDRVFTLDVVPIPGREYINIYARDITLQKQVESTREQLLVDNQRQQALLDAIFDAEPSGLAVLTGTDLHITYANPAFRYISPPMGENIVGLAYDQVWPGEVSENYISQIHEALETGKPFLVKGFERRFSDGRLRIFTLQVRRMQWGSQPAVLLILWDTTEQSLSETKYRDLAESITDNFVAYDRNLRCIFRNHSARGYSHIGPDEMVGKTFQELFPGLVGGDLHRAYLQVLHSHQPLTIETDWQNPQDGRTVTWEVNIYPTEDGVTAISKDITAKKQADILLRSSMQREHARAAELAALMDAVPAVIWISRDRECRDMVANRAGLEFLHVSDGLNISKSAPPDELAKQNFRNFKDGQEIPAAELPMQIAASTGKEAKNYEFDVVFDDGQECTLYGNVVPLNSEDGAPAGSLGAFLDITGRKATEQELKQSQERLEILSKAAADLLEGADPIQRLNEFFEDFSEKLGLEVYVQYNLAKDGSHLDLGSWAGFPEKYRKLLARLELGQAVCGTVAKTRNRMIVEDVQGSDDRKTALIRKLGIHTYACHPLIAHGRLLGTLSFGSRNFDRLPAETIELLRTFCHLVASAMDRKQTEDELQAHEKQYLDLLRNTNAVFYEVDFSTQRFTSVNDAMCLLSGYSKEELFSMSAFDLLEENSQRRFRERISKWMSGEKPESLVEYEVKAKDGHIIHALLNVIFKKDANGKPLGASVIAQDITERKHMEMALRQSEDRFRQVLENSLDVAYRRDLLADRYDYMSPVVEQVLGLSTEEMQKLSIEEVTEYIHPDDRQKVAEGIEIAARTGKMKLVYRFRTPLGDYRWIADYVATTKDDRGKPIYRTGILRDITEDIITEQRLQRDRWMLALASQMAHLGAGEVPISSRGELLFDQLFWSDEVYRIFGYSPGELDVSRNLFLDHVLPDQRRNLIQEVLKAVDELYPFNIEFQISRRDGDIRTLQLQGEILKDENGLPSKLVGAVQDITTLRLLEANQVEYRTRVEVQRRLLEQREQERLQIARELHDGPMQDFIATTFTIQEILTKTQDPALQADLQNLLEKTRQRIHELRAFSGQLRPPTLDQFGLVAAMQSHVDTFHQQYPGIRVRVDGKELGDKIPNEKRLALFRIFQEALNNTGRHSGATRVDVQLKKLKNIYCLVIEDNGCGFTPPRDMLQLAREGHLGLVGMRERAEAIGGKLVIDSSPQGGTRLVVELPLLV